MSAFIDEYRSSFAVELICATLGVSASAYYHRATGQRSDRAIEDERLLGVICDMHAANYYAYGYRRMWKALSRAGEDVGRDQVKRLMHQHKICGAKRRGKPWRTTRSDPTATRAPDRVQRDFSACRPDETWFADFTYLRCWEGLVFFSFVIDAYSRMIVGWQFASHMRTDLVLDALRMALGQRQPGADVALVHHSDAGSQPGVNQSSQHLTEGSCDDDRQAKINSCGNALAGASAGSPQRAPTALLGSDRSGSLKRSRRPRGWRLGTGGQPLVSRGWRDANSYPSPAVGALPVIRRAGRDRAPARPRLWSA